jgi:hypothetical protein
MVILRLKVGLGELLDLPWVQILEKYWERWVEQLVKIFNLLTSIKGRLLNFFEKLGGAFGVLNDERTADNYVAAVGGAVGGNIGAGIGGFVGANVAKGTSTLVGGGLGGVFAGLGGLALFGPPGLVVGVLGGVALGAGFSQVVVGPLLGIVTGGLLGAIGGGAGAYAGSLGLDMAVNAN